MANHWDIGVYDEGGHLTLGVEVRSIQPPHLGWVTEWKRLNSNDGVISRFPYFLLVSPTTFFLWNDTSADEPNYVINAAASLDRYFGQVNISREEIDGSSFEMIVSWWLGDLMRGRPESAPPTEFIESGLFDAISQGRFAAEVTV